MPTYEYGCDACGHQFEREQSIKDKPVKKCPQCGRLKARRMISQGNFILKGGGWYSDLYSGPSNKSDAPPKPAADAAASDTASADGGDAKKVAEPTKKAEPAKPKKAKAEKKKA